MNNKNKLAKYIRRIKRKNELTSFISYIFTYNNLQTYNYIFRLIEEESRVIIDIYDNISNNRFNRYIFNFNKTSLKSMTVKENNIFVTYINIYNLPKNKNNIYKLGYLFKLDNNKMIKYANTFLEQKYIDILLEIIK